MDAFVALLMLMQAETSPLPRAPTEVVSGVEAQAPEQQATIASADEERVCRRRERIGTRFAREECRTRAEADAEQQRARETMRDITENSGRNNTRGD